MLAASSSGIAAQPVRVTASVVPFFVASIDQRSATLTITDVDLERGYVEVDGEVIRVRTNDPAGYLVSFRVNSALIARAEITGLKSELSIGSNGGFVVQHLERIGTTTMALRYRLSLSNTSRAGTYDFPVRATLHSLNK